MLHPSSALCLSSLLLLKTELVVFLENFIVFLMNHFTVEFPKLRQHFFLLFFAEIFLAGIKEMLIFFCYMLGIKIGQLPRQIDYFRQFTFISLQILVSGGNKRRCCLSTPDMLSKQFLHDFFNKSEYRNAPMWEIPIELKRQFPSLPIITDPSHICGKREMIFAVSQKAIDLEMDGLMIETHYNPDKALTDARQQLSPIQLHELLAQLVIREKTGNIEIQSKLDQLRCEIDKLDAEMIEVLSKRFGIVREIGHYKKENNITILQQKRWDYVLNDRTGAAAREGITTDFINHLLELIHDESIQIQTDIMNKRSIGKSNE